MFWQFTEAARSEGTTWTSRNLRKHSIQCAPRDEVKVAASILVDCYGLSWGRPKTSVADLLPMVVLAAERRNPLATSVPGMIFWLGMGRGISRPSWSATEAELWLACGSTALKEHDHPIFLTDLLRRLMGLATVFTGICNQLQTKSNRARHCKTRL